MPSTMTDRLRHARLAVRGRLSPARLPTRARGDHLSFGRLMLGRDRAEELSRELRLGGGPSLASRRRIVALYLLASGSMGVVSLYQMGITKRLPELPLPGFDAPRSMPRLRRTRSSPCPTRCWRSPATP